MVEIAGGMFLSLGIDNNLRAPWNKSYKGKCCKVLVEMHDDR
jgi:hypothetical protein